MIPESLFPIRGTVDPDGRLLDADPPLAALHVQAGGRPSGLIVIPQLLALVRLVAQLRSPVSRPVATADNGTDVELFVHARPENDNVRIDIVEWRTRPSAPALGGTGELCRNDFARAGADFTWAVDGQLVLVAISAEAAAASGATEAAMVGLPLTRLFSLVEGEDGAIPLLDAFAGQHGFSGQQARLRGSDLGLITLAAIPLFDDSGAFAGFRGTATRGAEAQAVVDLASAEEQDAPQARADESFGPDIGRALKGPLDRIIANADVIREQADGPLRRGYAEYAADIAAAGRHLMSLVDDLVEVQTIEHHDFHPDPEPIDLCDIARRAAGLLSVRAADSNVRIDAPALDEVLPATGEFRRVLQILVNLIGNAVRHSPPGGMVWLRAEQERGQAIMIVADQGEGIALDDQSRIFEKFERLGRTDPGSGLGLYISRRLARAMGGDLTVDSAPGQGARFILSLPLRK